MMVDEKIIITFVEKLNLTMNLLADDADKPVLVTVANIKDAIELFNRQKTEIYDLKSTLSEVTISYDVMRGVANSYKLHYESSQAEIERLQKEGLQINKIFMDFVNKQKMEAIKEFTELIKKAFPSIAMAVDFMVKEKLGKEDEK